MTVTTTSEIFDKAFLTNLSKVTNGDTTVTDADIIFVDSTRIYRNPSMKPPSRDRVNCMTDDVARCGITTPLILRGKPDNCGTAVYEIADGHCRFEAARRLELPRLPAVVIKAPRSLEDELNIIARLHEPDAADMFVRAGIYSDLLMLANCTQDKIARRLGISQSNVANRLRLLHMTEAERVIIRENNLSERHARALLRIPSSKQRLAAAEHVAAARLTVAQTEAFAEEVMREGCKTDAVEHVKYRIHDIGLFYNTIDRAVDILKRSGVDAKAEKFENGSDIDIRISLRK